jgi:hypothetical protein
VIVGTLKFQKLSDDEICQRYEAGDSQGLISLKARISTAQVRAILQGRGVRLRGQPESVRLSLRTFDSTRRMRQRSANLRLVRDLNQRPER